MALVYKWSCCIYTFIWIFPSSGEWWLKLVPVWYSGLQLRISQCPLLDLGTRPKGLIIVGILSTMVWFPFIIFLSIILLTIYLSNADVWVGQYTGDSSHSWSMICNPSQTPCKMKSQSSKISVFHLSTFTLKGECYLVAASIFNKRMASRASPTVPISHDGRVQNFHYTTIIVL